MSQSTLSPNGIAERKMAVAQAAAQELSKKLVWVCVCVFGSVARGHVSRSSDIDLLVVGKYRRHSRVLQESLERDFPRERVSIQYFSKSSARRAFLTRPDSFVRHLLLESKILVDRDDFLQSLFESARQLPWDPEAELARERQRLRALWPLKQFNHQYLFYFARLFFITKAIVLLRLLAENSPSFDRATAFRSYCRHHPDSSSSVETLQELEPFYLLVTRGVQQDLPFEARGSDDKAKRAYEAVLELAS